MAGISIVFANLPDGLNNMSLWDQAFAEAAAGPVAPPNVVTGAAFIVTAQTQAVVIQRTAPSATAIYLPPVADQIGIPIRIIDWSTGVTDHTITIYPDGTETIMQQATWPIYSTSVSLASLMLTPANVLNGWYISP